MPDRLELLRAQTALTGIDFVYVADNQTTIDVYWHVEPDTLDVPLDGTLTVDDVTIGSTHGIEHPTVPVTAVSWPSVQGRRVLRLTVDEPGDFVTYRLAVLDARVDDFYNDVPFSFKAGCPSRLDCAPRTPPCPDDLPPAPPTDHTARDFWQLRRAMLDAATLLEPTWQDRSVADELVMLVEVLASIGDELSYAQDRIAQEAYLETATQLHSLRRHAQLVDHRMHDGLGGSTWLAVTAGGPVGIGNLAAGTPVWAELEAGTRVSFAIGTGLDDELDSGVYEVDERRNALTPHLYDDGSDCLPAGATTVTVVGHVGAAFPAPGDPPLMVALHEDPADAGVPRRTWVLPVTSGVDDDDPVVPDPLTAVAPAPVTVLTWDAADAPPFDFSLTETVVLGNIVPATAGSTRTTNFVVGPAPVAPAPVLTEAVERQGPGGSTEFMHSLPDPEGLGLVWRPAGTAAVGGGGDVRTTLPELAVLEQRAPDPPVRWEWRPQLVGPSASAPTDRHVTLDDGLWGPAATYHRPGAQIVHADRLAGTGYTVRFGDGEFGAPPPQGGVFDVAYRVGNGRAGNVPAGAIRHHDGSDPLLVAVTNPLAVVDGAEAESVADTRRVAPYEWQTVTYRAVRTEDYAEALTRLDWVQAAGAVSRWTGSWLSIVATPDPRDAVALTDAWRTEAREQLDRFRQAGRDVILGEPRYADLDLDLTVCVERSSYRGEVVRRVQLALLGDPERPAAPYFFDPDRFVFGTPLNRAALEAAVQAVPGVREVEGGTYRRRGHFGWRPLPAVVLVAPDELVRVVNDTAHPERGTVRILTKGGA
jgi:hypothetical protein